MKTSGAGGIIGAMFFAAIASCATYANAQTSASTPAGAGVQRVAASTSPPGTRPDTSIIRDVRRAIRRVPDLDDSEIHIRARLGVVTLTGWVPESWQISRAGIAARNVLGVRAVSNRLKAHDEDAGS
ncbi:BON domain-containing protein [Paraburkholderia adhaesiva]|uniref:BON domain-containing protein n=1 Tax=Paraburkholderia adhaesiva TaxID=2883244 RepID=UPI001F2CE161|nr:BON domain-containing protein [Paraburkholderia adhaesiva]